MLSDLVQGGGCAEDGPGGRPNALSKLSGTLSRGFGQEQNLRRAPHGAGPSNSFGGLSEDLIPAPSGQEAAFLEAFAGDPGVPLDAQMRGPAAELAWREAIVAVAADHRFQMRPIDATSMLATADAAWASGAPRFGPEASGPSGFAAAPHWLPEPGHQQFSAGVPAPHAAAQLQAGQLVRQTLHRAEQHAPPTGMSSDPQRWDALRSLDLPAHQADAAVRRADALLRMLKPSPAPQPAWRSHRHVDSFTAAGLGRPTQQLGALPWQTRAGTAAPLPAPASALEAAARAQGEAVGEAEAAATLREKEGRAEAVWTPGGGDIVAEMEAAWAAAGQIPSVTATGGGDARAGLERDVAAVSTGGSQLDVLEQAWGELSLEGGVGGIERLWESMQQAGMAEAEAVSSAWEAAMFTGMDEYLFRENNSYLGQHGLLAHGSALFDRGELAEAVMALEAAVQAEPEDSAAWQLLGQAHADADDDARVSRGGGVGGRLEGRRG